MYRQRLWTMRQYAGYSSAAESNRRYRYLLEQGTTGLSVAFDLPTQIGFDSDHPMARGEVGRVGVAIDSIADMRRLFDQIPLDRVTTSMTINATAPILLAFYLAVAEEQGVAWSDVGGTVQNDILKEYAARGTYIYPPGPSLRLVVDVIAFCAERVPRWNPISISGYHMREAGSTAVQEVAFTLANALEYVDGALARGLAIDEFASAPVVLLQRPQPLPRGGGEVPRRAAAVGRAGARALPAGGRALVLAALPHPDRRLDAHRPAARRQRGARRHPGAGGGVRRHPVAAHQRHGRGARPADRARRAAGAAHPAGDRPRERRRRRRRPARRRLGDRGVDRGDRRPRPRLHPPHRGARRRPAGDREGASSSTRSPRPPTASSAMSRRGARRSSGSTPTPRRAPRRPRC